MYIFLFFNFELVTKSGNISGTFYFWISRFNVNLVLYDAELVTQKKNFKLFELVTQSMISFCITQFCNSIIWLRNSKPYILMNIPNIN